MTPTKRAEKIVREYFENIVPDAVSKSPQLIKSIAAQIESAEREAVKTQIDNTFEAILRAEQRGWNAAREKAKGIALDPTIASSDPIENKQNIAARIGKMEPDTGGKRE